MKISGNRILEYSPSHEEAVVSRILVLIHQLIDEQFPEVEQAGRQFTKTVFSSDGESTASIQTPGESSESSSEMDAGSNRIANSSEQAQSITTPRTVPPFSHSAVSTEDSLITRVKAPPGATSSRRFVERSNFENPPEFSKKHRVVPIIKRADWTVRFLLALLIAGTIVLAYALMI